MTAVNQVEKWAYLYGSFYKTFQKKRLDFLEMMKDDDTYRFVFDEDLQYLTKDYYVSIGPQSIRRCTMTLWRI